MLAIPRLALPLLAVLQAFPAQATPPASPARPVSVDVVDSRFRVSFADGHVRHSEGLVGAILTIRLNGRATRVRIDAVERDTYETAPDVWLHTLSLQKSDGQWSSLCGLDPKGRTLAIPVAGRAGHGGMLAPAEPGRLEILCTAGAMAKCVRFGYRPWAADRNGVSMLAAHRACVRMVRADYSGREGTTRNGMLIDISDTLGIQIADGEPSTVFEAGWGPDGAVCVHHPRVKENVTLEQIEARHPQLRGRTGAICTEDFARAHGAIIFNRSRP